MARSRYCGFRVESVLLTLSWVNKWDDEREYANQPMERMPAYGRLVVFKGSKDQNGIVTPEAEGVRHDAANVLLPRGVGHIVEVTFRIGVV